MGLTSDRSILREMMEQFGQYWLTGQSASFPLLLADDAELISHQHGSIDSRAALLEALAQDSAKGELYGQHSNHYIAIEGDQAATSMYLFAMAKDNNAQYFLFGAAVVMRFRRHENGWLLHQIRLQVNWSHGNQKLMPHWKNVPSEHGWDLSKEPPVLVSELHSPWALLPNAAVPERLEEALPELYARYSFAVDQNDIGLLATTYSQDIEGGFAPAGNFKGHDNVISLLKNFRHLAAVWQHFAHIVRIEDEGDGKHAKMIVARVIPERPVSESGEQLYGAHYQLRVRRGEDKQWRVCWTDYRTGWFTKHSIPVFDIGRTTA
ncbi:nuclear transport factor 2 family protein [Vibrio sp. EA2]|uniref:nuclear transport factor 2 family protein n=1 Tax=Vibrio sp. EA2 TaxID=3079860 RepID=UPI002948F322|nr:nuclear transport factor 2 family protein [Vibrio sp. EA2]MDV6252589.1 nuclear transport factor 2 family protein [Vibrio sp. EA2]